MFSRMLYCMLSQKTNRYIHTQDKYSNPPAHARQGLLSTKVQTLAHHAREHLA